MKLTLEQLRAAARGCVSVTDEGGWFCFHRFTPEQEKIYNCSDKVYDTAGVLLAMHTDSPTLKLEAEMICTSSHSFFAFDVCVNGRRIGSMQNYGEETPTGNYASVKYPYGVFGHTFILGEGEKFLQIWLPATGSDVCLSAIPTPPIVTVTGSFSNEMENG